MAAPIVLITRRIRQTAVILLTTVLLACVVEGCASFVLLFRQLAAGDPPIAEREHTEYDPQLGWIHLPSWHGDDVYGPGKSLTTNSQRFRNRHDFTLEAPPGKRRIICLGDSFTMGFGVSDDESWCSLLEQREPRLETVNMGQGGYGFDEAYLWYLRDGQPLADDLLIVGVITADFYRMLAPTSFGFGKPMLELRDGELTATHVPASRWGYRFRWLTRNRMRFGELRLPQLLFGARDQPASAAPMMPVVVRALEKLAALQQARNAKLLVVYLPVLGDHRSDDAREWRELLRDQLAKRGIAYLDLVEELRKRQEPPEPLFAGHYSVEENRWVAELLMPRIRQLLEGKL